MRYFWLANQLINWLHDLKKGNISFNLLILMLFLPKATRARNSKSLYRLLYDTERKSLKWDFFFFTISHIWLLVQVRVYWPLSFKTQLWPQKLNDLAHRLVDVAFLGASHKTLKQLHGEELPFFTKARAHQGVCACKEEKKKFLWSNAAQSHPPTRAGALAACCSMTNKTSPTELCMIPTGFIRTVEFTCE